MQKYAIYEENMERLTAKLTRIQNKCRKYGCDFHFATVGEEFRTEKDKNGTEIIKKFFIVEAEGIARINGWRFIASVERTENGNIIDRAVDIEVPERYYYSAPYCEHCKTRRFRKSTYIVMNEETGEFKQVGHNCLNDYTHGMNASAVALYVSAFDELIKGEVYEGGGGYGRYINVESMLLFAAETVRHFGYRKSAYGVRSTSERAWDYYDYKHGGMSGYFEQEYRRQIEKEMEACGFNEDSAEAAELVKAAVEWLAGQEESNTYMHNLKTVCGLRYTERKNIGLIVSLFPTYDRGLEIEEAKRKEAEAAKISQWVGAVGERVSEKIESAVCVTSWDSEFGTVRIYKFVSNEGNVFVWKTTKWLDTDNVSMIKGTVKEHKEYRSVKQTELTRCKVA